jgi:hypothetical protein
MILNFFTLTTIGAYNNESSWNDGGLLCNRMMEGLQEMTVLLAHGEKKKE